MKEVAVTYKIEYTSLTSIFINDTKLEKDNCYQLLENFLGDIPFQLYGVWLARNNVCAHLSVYYPAETFESEDYLLNFFPSNHLNYVNHYVLETRPQEI